ncbi:MAG: helix-turn-helix domain-containing protein [Rikenellaceae bacterium]
MDISKVGYQQFKQYAAEYLALIAFIENYDPRCKIEITEEDFIDNSDLCLYMHCDDKTTYRLRRDRRIPYFKVRKKIYYRLRDMKMMIEKNFFPDRQKSMENIIDEYGAYIKQRQSRR